MSTATGAAQATLRDLARLIALVASGLIAGAVLATGLADTALSGSAELYTAYRQATNGLFTATLPPLGGLALLAAAASAVLHQGRARTLSLAAAGCFVAALAVTVLVHFPLNAEILTWSPARRPLTGSRSRPLGGRSPRTHPAHPGRVRRAHPRPLAGTRRAALIQRGAHPRAVRAVRSRAVRANDSYHPL